MMIQVEFWQVLSLAITLVLAVVGGFWAVAKVAGKQLDEKLEARFDAIETTLKNHSSERREQGDKLHKVELELANLRSELPVHYVPRKEYEKSPSHSDLGKIYESVAGLSATVNRLVGENVGQTDTLRLILNKIAEKGMQ